VLNEKNGRSALMERGCEACHGPGGEHVQEEGTGGKLVNFSNATPELIDEGKAACLSCHERGARVHWKGSPHDSRDIACTDCHTIMKKVSTRNQLKHATETELCGSCHLVRRAQMFRNAHMPVREGAMSCSSCHRARQRHAVAGEPRHDQRQLPAAAGREARPSVGARVRQPRTRRLPRSCTVDAARMLKLNPPRLLPAVPHRDAHRPRRASAGEQFVIGRSCCSVTRTSTVEPPVGFVFPLTRRGRRAA
jgi:hypothetical protein